MKTSNINELLLLMNQYEQNIRNNYQELKRYKEITKKYIIEIMKKDIDNSKNNNRLQQFLEQTKISDLNFLYRSLVYMRGNNLGGPLTTEKLIISDKETKSIAESYGITTESQLFHLIIDHFYHSKTHPLLKEEKIINSWNKFQTLAYLDEFFKDVNNCLNYQGSYTTFKYVKNYLKTILIEDIPENDSELVFKNGKIKLTLATEKLIPIANELLILRNSIPNSRISVCNQGLKRTANKVPGSQISFEQQIFINAIAFGTTLEKLENDNYEDVKQLLYLPHHKITK